MSFPSPSPGYLPDLGIELGSPALQADSLPSDPQGKPTRSILVGGKDPVYSSAVTMSQDAEEMTGAALVREKRFWRLLVVISCHNPS